MSALALCRSCSSRSQTIAAKDVLPLGDRLQMSRSTTGSIATEMVDRQAAGDRPDEVLVDDSMDVLAVRPAHLDEVDPTVSRRKSWPGPLPTLADDRDARPEPGWERRTLGDDHLTIRSDAR